MKIIVAALLAITPTIQDQPVFNYFNITLWAVFEQEGSVQSSIHLIHPSPEQHVPAPPGGSKGIPRPDEIYNPSSEFWVFSQSVIPRKPPKGGTLEAS